MAIPKATWRSVGRRLETRHEQRWPQPPNAVPSNAANPRRLLVIAAEPPWPVSNGVRTKLAGLVEHAGIPVDLITPAGVEPAAGTPGVMWKELPARSRARRVRAILSGNLPISTLLPPEDVLNAIAGLVRHGARYDLVHLDTMGTVHLAEPVRTYLGSRGQGPTIIASLNDSYSLLLASGGLNDRIARRAYGRYVRFVERRLLSRVDFVDVVSEGDLAWLRQAVPVARCRLVPLAVDTSYFAGPRLPVAWDMLYLGTMCAEAFYWLKSALEAVLPAARAVVPGFRVATAGPDPTPEALRFFHDNNVHYLGFAGDLSGLLRSSRMLLVTSRQRAGTPTKALQAMSAGTPIIGVEALLGIPNGQDHVTFSMAQGWDELAQRAVRVLTDDDYARSVGEGGRQLAIRQHDWSVVLERYLQFTPTDAQAQ